jgi:hypothetical protein
MKNKTILSALSRRKQLERKLARVARESRRAEKAFTRLMSEETGVRAVLAVLDRVKEIYKGVPLEVRRFEYDSKRREFHRLDVNRWAEVYPASMRPDEFGVNVRHESEKFGERYGGKFLGFFKSYRVALRMAREFAVSNLSQDEFWHHSLKQ